MRSHSFKVLALLAPATVFAGTLRHATESSSLGKRDLTPGSNLPTGWQYTGCYTDSVSDRKLSGASYADASGMTDESCIAFCSAKGFTVAGTEYSSECYCGYAVKSSSAKVDTSQCNMACSGDKTEACGAGDRLTVFSNGGTGAGYKDMVNGFKYRGCFSDDVSNRALSYLASNAQTSASMTIEVCTTACSSQRFQYAGLEYGGECWCGNTLGSSAHRIDGYPSDTGCSMTCNGDRTEWCGGSNRLTLYNSTGAATTTTTTTTSAGPTGGPTNILYNPGFESSSNWYFTGDNYGGGRFSTGSSARTGNGFLSAGASQSSGVSGPRGACVAQDIYVPTTGAYALSFHSGAVDEFRPDPRAPNGRPQYSLVWSVNLDGTTKTGSPCYGSSCSETDVGGTLRYAPTSYTQTLQQGYTKITICANYDGARRGQDDDFYLDDVTLTGPA